MLLALCAASAVACSASAPSNARPPHAATDAESVAAEAAEEDIEDEGELRAKRVESRVAGTRAPAPVVSLLDGGSLDLASLVGHKPVYLKFWATWCVPCREQMGHFEAVHQRFGDHIAVIAVNVGLNESKDAVRAFRREHGLSMPIGYDSDGRVARAFHNEVTPQHVLIDASGAIVYVGHQASDTLDQALEAVTSGESVSSNPGPAAEARPSDPSALTVQLLDGQAFEIGAPRDKPTVLSFVATWCDWYLADSRPAMARACVAQQERLNAVHETLGAEAEFVGVALSLWTDEAQLRSYRERYGIRHALALDRGARVFDHFGVRDVPTTIVLDRNGVEQFRMTGDPVELSSELERISKTRHAVSLDLGPAGGVTKTRSTLERRKSP